MLEHNCKGNVFQFLFSINRACVTALAEACQALPAAVTVGQSRAEIACVSPRAAKG